MKKWVTNLAVALSSIVVALVIAEVLLRVFSLPEAATCGWKRGAGVPVDEVNQLGFRGREFSYSDSDYVVLLLGDSQVEAIGCSFEEMPEVLLENALDSLLDRRVRVFSIGAPGYGQDQENLALLRYLESWRADLVVLWETPANDLWNNVFPTHWPGTADGWPKPTYWIEDGQLAGPNYQLGDEVRASDLHLVDFLLRQLTGWSLDVAWEGRLPEPYRPLESTDDEVRDEWQQRWDDNHGIIREENPATEKCHLAIYFTPRSSRMDYAVRLADLLLVEIDRHLDSLGIELVVFATANIPDSTGDVESAVYSLNGQLYAVSRNQYYRNVEDMNRSVTFLAVPITVENWTISDTDSHLNSAGNAQVMKDLADSLAVLIDH